MATINDQTGDRDQVHWQSDLGPRKPRHKKHPFGFRTHFRAQRRYTPGLVSKFRGTHKTKAEPTSQTFFNPYDYEKKYPPDGHGEEAGPNARVWWTYLDVAEDFDTERIEGWKDTIDVLLIFAALFSAVVTGFVIQAWQNGQTDYAQVSANLLAQLIAVQIAIANGTSPSGLPSLSIPSEFDIDLQKCWVNALWYTSLSLSIATALIAMVTKQWLHQHTSFVPGTVRERTMTRQYRLNGLEKWGVPFIIDTLPFIMHLSLALFLIGLVVFLLPLNDELPSVCGLVTGVTYMLYMVSVILPIFHPSCPYRTPLTGYTFAAQVMLKRLGLQLAPHLRNWLSILQSISRRYSQSRKATKTTPDSEEEHTLIPNPTSLKEAERQAVDANHDDLQVESLRWLFEASNATARNLVDEAIGGLQADPEDKFPESWLDRINKRRTDGILDDKAKERLCRSYVALQEVGLWQNVFAGQPFPNHPELNALSLLSSIRVNYPSGTIINLPYPDELPELPHSDFFLAFMFGDQASTLQHPLVWKKLTRILLSNIAIPRRDPRIVMFLLIPIANEPWPVIPHEGYSVTLRAALVDEAFSHLANRFLHQGLPYRDSPYSGRAEWAQLPYRRSGSRREWITLMISILGWVLGSWPSDWPLGLRCDILNIIFAKFPELIQSNQYPSGIDLEMRQAPLFLKFALSELYRHPYISPQACLGVLHTLHYVSLTLTTKLEGDCPHGNLVFPYFHTTMDVESQRILLQNIVQSFHRVRGHTAPDQHRAVWESMRLLMHHWFFDKPGYCPTLSTLEILREEDLLGAMASMWPLTLFVGTEKTGVGLPDKQKNEFAETYLCFMETLDMDQRWATYIFQRQNLFILCQMALFGLNFNQHLIYAGGHSLHRAHPNISLRLLIEHDYDNPVWEDIFNDLLALSNREELFWIQNGVKGEHHVYRMLRMLIDVEPPRAERSEARTATPTLHTEDPNIGRDSPPLVIEPLLRPQRVYVFPPSERAIV
ncbi:hypothetical protein C8J57DRAFT_1673702 [Mycena rebaudengoi]|nr:hypothetical protein C8J57DRAFT_1147496 [Mycena rebaudengoi]KAJ7247460.1 hypothetical protein C8J57DRAFT_1673702 [Mycena rebaudengoi]